ncbi:MAG TPA: type II toxin-antitoxin system prevent-host-death family antitoxin [Verrucomicrobiae bacterium]|jgi:prevent-host-death family protein|nr:type II toxin-antitoxin system prevent-host-death family antitoxin [Verrucomicrobiae bacterium]
MTTTAEIAEFNGKLAELVKEVQAGNEVLLTQGRKPVAKIISASQMEMTPGSKLQIRSLKGHKVLIPGVASAEVADELFGRR